MDARSYTAEERRAANQVWAAAGAYGFEPLFLARNTDGTIDFYMSCVVRLVHKYYGDDLLRDLFATWDGDLRESQLDDLTWLYLESAGYLLELPVVFAKKKKPSTMENMLVTSVYSFTKQRSYDVCVSKDFLAPGDQVLFIDDFLANGNAAKGIMDLVKQAGAELVGMGFIIEKAFQHGGDELRSQGIHVESLAIIESLDNCEIKIR